MTLTVAGNKKFMAAKRSKSARGSNDFKTTKTMNLNSIPLLPPGYVQKLLVPPAVATGSTAAAASIPSAGCELECGSVYRLALRSASSPISDTQCNASHPIDTREGSINYPMNIVSDTPEPYLEPIKLLNKQSAEERKQSLSAARSFYSGVPAEKPTAVLRQVSKSCFTGTKFPSASSRPIPPPKVLLKRQESARVSSSKEAEKPKAEFSPTSAKRRELAYLIVDLESGRSAIGTKNNRALDDSDVGLKSLRQEKSYKFPVRSFTMSVPGDQIKRPVVKPRPSRNISQDSIKECLTLSGEMTAAERETAGHRPTQSPASVVAVSMETQPLDTHRESPEIFVSTGEETMVNGIDRNHTHTAAAPPPVPLKRGAGKATSPVSPIASRMLRCGRSSLPATSIMKDLQNVHVGGKPERDERVTSPLGRRQTESTGYVSQKPGKNRLPPPKPKPYSERLVSPPPPPSFPPPPRPKTSSISSSPKPPSPPPARKISSPIPPPKTLTMPPSPSGMGMRTSHSSQTLLPPGNSPNHSGRARLLSDSKGNKPKPPKPPPPSRPPPVNCKLTQLINDNRSRTKSTCGIKGNLTLCKVKPSISEPRLISTTMQSDSRSMTDLRVIQDQESEDQFDEDEPIPLSNISYVSTMELFADQEDHPSPLYEDIDSIIPLPPRRTEVLNKAATNPLGRKASVDSILPELPPKDYLGHPDPLGRRRRRKKSPPLPPQKTHLSKTMSLSSNVERSTSFQESLQQPRLPKASSLSSNMHMERSISSPESPLDEDDPCEPYYVKKMVTGEEEEDKAVQDTGAYESVRSPGFDVGDETEEPDVGGVDEYVMMGSVMSRAWEKEDTESVKVKEDLSEDLPEDSYVEMQPVAVSSPSPVAQDISRNFYELDDEPEPIYIEMKPEELLPPKQLHYASNNLFTSRPDLQAKKKKSKKLFHISGKK